MKPLAIIPARAGSKRLPGKNRELVGGMSLVEHAANMAADIGLPTFITTDDVELFQRAASSWRTNGVLRSPDLCRDDTPMMDVVRDAVMHAVAQGTAYDSVVLLQPTSPLRTVEDVQGVLALLDGGAEAAISVVEEPVPELFTLGHAGRLRPFEALFPKGHLVRPNGAVYAVRRDVLEAGFDWWTAGVVEGYVMPPERSVDIDTIYDLEEARRLWNQRQP